MRTLLKNECSETQGAALEALIMLIEIPHVLMGLREFINYSVDFYEYGCDNIDSRDHVGQALCSWR